MVQYSFPWDKDGGGDKGPYEYTLFARFMATLYHRDGLFPRDNDSSNTSLQVKQQTVPDMSIRVATGAALVEGNVLTERHIYFSDAFETVEIDDNLSADDRIDLIILRLDYATQEVRLDVLLGTPAGSPVAPSLQQDGTYWEIALAEILVAAGESTSITTGDITMTASNATLWPVVEGGTGIDTIAAGELLAGNGANSIAALAAPSDYMKLVSDAALPGKMKWVGSRNSKLRANNATSYNTTPVLVPFASADWYNPDSYITYLTANQWRLAAGAYHVRGFMWITASGANPTDNSIFFIADSTAPTVALATSEVGLTASTGAYRLAMVDTVLVSDGSQLFECYIERSAAGGTTTLRAASLTGLTPATAWNQELVFERIK